MNKRLLSFVTSIVLVAIPVVGWLQRDKLFDTWRLRNYTPTSEVVHLADVTTMTPGARNLFYVYHPQLDDKTSFSNNCGNEEQTIVLGCYILHKGIYLYNVPDNRLNGVEEVTAAHEMLHAQYDRLSSSDKKKVDAWTAEALKGITDERLLQTVENYRKKDPSVVPNELHSILGTEVRSLPPDLENYYKRYFADRSKVVDFADAYKGEFTSREQQVASIDKQLATVKSQIDSLNASLETQQVNLKNQYNALQQQKKSGQIEAYNQAVPAYNLAVQQYNADVNKQRSLVTQYNNLVEERNNLAVEENQLIKALDSRETIQTQ
jgi:hypothetical protein